MPGATPVGRTASPLTRTSSCPSARDGFWILVTTTFRPAGTRAKKTPVPTGPFEPSRGEAPGENEYGPNGRTPTGRNGWPGWVFHAPVLSAIGLASGAVGGATHRQLYVRPWNGPVSTPRSVG